MMSGPTNIPPMSTQASPSNSHLPSGYNQGASLMSHQQPQSQYTHQFISGMDENMHHQHHMNHLHSYLVPGEDDLDESMDNSIPLREQDRLLPIANVARIMKMAVPSNAKIAKDAKETVQECVSEFIAFVTSEASDRCQQEKRKTINGEDILWAMESLGFDHYVQLLKIYLQKYKETLKFDKDITGTTLNIPLLPGHHMHRSISSLEEQARMMNNPSMSLFHPNHPSHN